MCKISALLGTDLHLFSSRCEQFVSAKKEEKNPVCLCCNYFSLSIISAVSDFTVPFIRKLYPQLFSGFNYQINESVYISLSYISFCFYFVITFFSHYTFKNNLRRLKLWESELYFFTHQLVIRRSSLLRTTTLFNVEVFWLKEYSTLKHSNINIFNICNVCRRSSDNLSVCVVFLFFFSKFNSCLLC